MGEAEAVAFEPECPGGETTLQGNSSDSEIERPELKVSKNRGEGMADEGDDC